MARICNECGRLVPDGKVCNHLFNNSLEHRVLVLEEIIRDIVRKENEETREKYQPRGY